jgi:hypothetical protein
VALWRKLLALTALPGLAAAADPRMMDLIMPDASMVMEINIANIMASPIGSAIREAVHKGIATQLEGEAAKAKPQFQELIAGLGNIDWGQEVQDIVIAGGPGKHPPMLIIARSSLDPAGIRTLKAFSGGAAEYEGVPILASSKPGNGTIAFLDGGIVAIGQMSDVKAAIHRRGQHTPLPAALAEQVAKYSQDDLWFASTAILTDPLPDSPAMHSPAGAQMGQFIEKVAGFNGGLRFSPDFDFSGDLIARTDKGAAELAEGLRSLTGMIQSQAKIAGQGSGLEAFKYRMNGKHILLSLHVPEAQVRAGLQQMRAAQARQTVAVSRQAARQAARQAQAPPVIAPSSGLPPPPAGTIRVQSSDMGTVLIPVGKQQ